MKVHTYLEEGEMIQRAINVLLENLGSIETVRFLTLPRQRRLDSVMRHRCWQDALDKDRFFEQVFGSPSAEDASASPVGREQHIRVAPQ